MLTLFDSIFILKFIYLILAINNKSLGKYVYHDLKQ